MGPSPSKPAQARIDRQAVILIHGIGEQRPMDTLRGFIDAIIARDENGDARYYSKFDADSDNFELRRLITRSARPRTEFYEFYWAHLMPDATWRRILAWLQMLLLRPITQIPTPLRSLWWTLWLFVVTALGVIIAASIFAVWPSAKPDWWPQSTTLITSLPIVTLLLAIAQGKLLGSIGDAAIYLSAEPGTIEARQKIRIAGLALLEKLHSRGDIDRIVIVGHSLGSVIGYDLINLFWQRTHEGFAHMDRPDSKPIGDVEKVARNYRRQASDQLAPLPPCLIATWETMAQAAWQTQRQNGNGWLISDFVTLGSPLAHSRLLLARSTDDFRRRLRQRELPIAPPQPAFDGRISYGLDYKLDDGSRRTAVILDDAAPFAVTRWTNLYFPCTTVVHGDLVGGPLAPLFGPAIRDVAVATTRWRGFFSHTAYWRVEKAGDPAANPVTALKRAMRLDLKQGKFER